MSKMIDVFVNPVNSIISRNSLTFSEFIKVIKVIDSILKVREPNYKYMPSYQSGLWDGYIRFITPKGVFLTGLLPLVGELYQIKRIYKNPNLLPRECKLDLTLKNTALRDYQIDAVKNCIEKQRGILKMPTGSGKTEVGCCIIKNLSTVGKCLWLTDSLTLVEQSKIRIQNKTDLKPTECSKGDVDLSGDVVVSTIQTIFRRLDSGDTDVKDFLNNRVGTVILDECHLGSANTWEKVLRECKSAWYRFGLSATPETDSPVKNMKLMGLLGDIIYTVNRDLLIKDNYITDSCIYIMEHRHKQYMSYPDAITYGIVENEGRNKKILDIASKNDLGLILVKSIKQGILLERMAKNMGTDTVFLQGETSGDIRMKSITDLREGKYKFIIASTIFDFGVDIPEVKYVFLASPTKSSIRIIQRIGRGSRKSKGKTISKIYAFSDIGDKFLESAYKKLYNVVLKEGFNVIKL